MEDPGLMPGADMKKVEKFVNLFKSMKNGIDYEALVELRNTMDSATIQNAEAGIIGLPYGEETVKQLRQGFNKENPYPTAPPALRPAPPAPPPGEEGTGGRRRRKSRKSRKTVKKAKKGGRRRKTSKMACW